MDIFGGEIMKPKVYIFRYKNKTEKFTDAFFSACTNFGVPIITYILITLAISIIGITEYISINLWMALFFVSVISGILMMLKYSFSFKGVVLYEDKLKILTHTFGLGGSGKPKIVIKYTDIISVYNSTYNLKYDRKKARACFLVGDFSYYIELTLRGGKQFCFSVNDQEEFVEELIERINDYRLKHNLKEL